MSGMIFEMFPRGEYSGTVSFSGFLPSLTAVLGGPPLGIVLSQPDDQDFDMDKAQL